MAVRIFYPKLSFDPPPIEDSVPKLRSSTSAGRNNVPSWKLHLLDLLTKTPKGSPVHCIDPTGIFRLSRYISEIAIKSPPDDPGTSTHPIKPIKPVRTKEERELMESRIRSLRLDIGDLSIAENLEKLCDHYFKLDKNGTLRKLQVENYEKQNLDVDFENAFPPSELATVTQESTPMTPEHVKVPQTPRKKKSVKIANPYWANISLAQSPLFHGLLTKKQTERLLKSEGQFLTRHLIHEPGFILSFNFNGSILNFRIIEEGGLFYLEDRKTCYGSLEEMVNDGLRSLYLDMKAGDYVDIMTELAQINKHDSMISWLSPTSSTSGSNSAINSRKSSAIGFSRQVSQYSPVSSVLSDLDQELNEHWFAPGLVPVKKSICEICNLKLKGSFSFKSSAMTKTMLTCRDCGLTIHEDCLIKVESCCAPELSKLPEIFGTDLTTIVKCVDKSSPPFVIVKCIQEIEKRGLNSEGIYRVSGSQDAVQSLQAVFETDRENASLDSFSDVNSICGVLKLYLRLLPDPLITKDVFDNCFDSISIGDSQHLSLDTVRIGLNLLPPAHKRTLKYLLKHLNKVTQFKDSNKMSSYNLSSVLAPSIIVPQEMSLNVLKFGTDLVDILIRNYNEIYNCRN